MLFKEKLRELRLAAGLTQENLARKAGMTVASIRNHEQGQRSPSWLAVVKLAKALEVSTDVFSECALDEEEAERDRKKRKGGRRTEGHRQRHPEGQASGSGAGGQGEAFQGQAKGRVRRWQAFPVGRTAVALSSSSQPTARGRASGWARCLSASPKRSR
jgi:transcriptional regulator with XRE-family HTH domain